MALRKLYQVRDLIAECVTGPIFGELREGAAVRAFADVVNAKQGVIAEHPADYALIHVGDQDDVSGEIMTDGEEPRIVCRGTEVLVVAATDGGASAPSEARSRER